MKFYNINRRLSYEHSLVNSDFRLAVEYKIPNCQMRIIFSKLPLAFLLVFIPICFSTILSFAQVLPLDSVLNRIEKNNPMLKMYDEQITGVNNYAMMAKSWMPPTLSTGPWQMPYKGFNEGMWMITGEQMIPNPVKQKANYNFMNGMASVEKQGKAFKTNEMFSMAKQNYYEWVLLKKKCDVLVQTDSLLNYMLEIAQLRYTYKKEKLSNIYKAQAELYELRNMETMSQGDMKMRNVELNILMNAEKTIEFDVDTTLPAYNYELQLPDTSVISLARSDIKQFDASITTLKLQQKFEKSKRLPDFGIAYTHMLSLNGMPNEFSAMGTITIPIAPWSAKEYRSTIKGLENSVNAISYQKQAQLNEISGVIASILTQIMAVKTQLKNYKENIIPAYTKSYQTALLAYEQNTEDLFVVLEGIRMYRMAKMNELEQLNILLKLQVEYEKQMEIR